MREVTNTTGRRPGFLVYDRIRREYIAGLSPEGEPHYCRTQGGARIYSDPEARAFFERRGLEIVPAGGFKPARRVR